MLLLQFCVVDRAAMVICILGTELMCCSAVVICRACACIHPGFHWLGRREPISTPTAVLTHMCCTFSTSEAVAVHMSCTTSTCAPAKPAKPTTPGLVVAALLVHCDSASSLRDQRKLLCQRRGLTAVVVLFYVVFMLLSVHVAWLWPLRTRCGGLTPSPLGCW